MKTKISIALVLILAACGKSPDQIVNALTTTPANAEGGTVETLATALSSCPDGMKFLTATPGHASTCIDNTVSASGVKVSHSDAAQACGAQMKSLCTLPQLAQAYETGMVAAGYIWGAETSGTLAAIFINGTSPGFNQTGAHMQYYCCSR